MEKVYNGVAPKIGHIQNEWYNLTDACFFCHNGALASGLKEYDIHLVTKLVHLEDANAGEVLTVKLANLVPSEEVFVALEAKIVKVLYDGDWNWTILDMYYDQNPKDKVTVRFEVAEINY